ncbi:MAG TPA: hypothetical protein VG167_10155 [Verrucomicrobiae bacterium]|nr:hypothetical protein [Verrucomicrobiae bacterium]
MSPFFHTFRRRIVLVGALAVMVITGVLVAVWPREPFYQGRSLTYWLDRLPNREAIAAVKAIGAPCLPTLVARLESKPTKIAQVVERAATRIGHWNGLRLSWKSSRERLEAFAAILALRDSAKPILPALSQLAEAGADPEVRDLAEAALWQINHHKCDHSLIMWLSLRDLSGSAARFHGYCFADNVTNFIKGVMPTNISVGTADLAFAIVPDKPRPTNFAVTLVRFDASNSTISHFGPIIVPGNEGLRGQMSFSGRTNDYQFSVFTNSPGPDGPGPSNLMTP